MAKPSKNKEKLNDLEDEFKQIQEEHKSTNIDQYLINPEEDLPEFGAIDVYDYENDMLDVADQSSEVIENLADLFLGDAPDLINHPYIRQKKSQDMEDYADSRFLSKMAKKLMLQNLKQIDSGDNGYRMYEVATKLMSEIREMNKDSRKSRSEIEKFYKDLRNDMGLNDISEKNAEINDDNNDEEGGQIISNSDLNSKIDDIIKGKKSED